jgi:hypothetical protein
MHETAITAAATIFLMLCLPVSDSERQVVNDSGLPKTGVPKNSFFVPGSEAP